MALLMILFIILDVFVQYMPGNLILTYAPNYLRVPKEIGVIKVHTDMIWLTMLTVATFFIAVFATKSKVFDRVDLRKRYRHKSPQKTKIPFHDTRTVFHTCKNILLSVDFICNGMEHKNPPPQIMKDIEEMHKQITNGLGRLTHILNLYNSQTEVIENVKLGECIDNAIKEAKLPPDIVITKEYEDGNIYISADSLLIEEALINLLKNAADAIGQKNEKDGRIDIRILTERSWSCVSIRDNGCGIKRKDYKRIFTPLFSTKNTAQNWGVGLSFVLNAMTSLGGQISFRSKYGSFTEFEILLPMAQKKKRKGRNRQLKNRVLQSAKS